MTVSKDKIILKPEQIPNIELDFMNNTHFEEIEMVKDLGELVNTLMDDNTNKHIQNSLSQKLNAWLEHTIAHFERENELMKETGFPAYSIHKNEHEIALEQMRDKINNWTKNQNIELIQDYIFSLWPIWFNQHVNTMDMMTAKFAVNNGYINH